MTGVMTYLQKGFSPSTSLITPQRMERASTRPEAMLDAKLWQLQVPSCWSHTIWSIWCFEQFGFQDFPQFLTPRLWVKFWSPDWRFNKGFNKGRHQGGFFWGEPISSLCHCQLQYCYTILPESMCSLFPGIPFWGNKTWYPQKQHQQT